MPQEQLDLTNDNEGTGQVVKTTEKKVKKSFARGKKRQPEQAPEVVFSSDEEELDTVPDPFFDPNMDDEDEKWVSKKFRTKGAKGNCILCCPACFSHLSHESERHQYYHSQFRSLQVSNCRVCEDEPTRPVKGDTDTKAKYFKVRCSECDTEVGVRDNELTYHFFNVLPS